METDISRTMFGNEVKQLLARGHDSGKRPIARRLGRLLHKTRDNSPFVGDDNAALCGVGNLVNSESGYHIVLPMEREQIRQIDVGQHIAIKNKKDFFPADKPAVCSQRARASQQFLFFGNVNLHGNPVCLSEIPDLARVRVNIDQHLGNPRSGAVLQPYLEQRHALDGQQTLRDGVCEWSQPGAASRRQDEGLHHEWM